MKTLEPPRWIVPLNLRPNEGRHGHPPQGMYHSIGGQYRSPLRMDLALLSRLRSGSVLGLFPQPDVQQKSCHGQQPRRVPEIALRPVGDARCSHHCGDGSYSKHSVLLSSHHSACTAHLCEPVQPQGVHRRRIEQWGLSCWHLRNEPSIRQALAYDGVNETVQALRPEESAFAPSVCASHPSLARNLPLMRHGANPFRAAAPGKRPWPRCRPVARQPETPRCANRPSTSAPRSGPASWAKSPPSWRRLRRAGSSRLPWLCEVGSCLA